ncbi:hypothetical protein [Gilvibacter sp.]|uniref:hypothetical protein n=1 Tax=Gilvibacter sp. TaxID=2729997 RepID=UPI003B518E29
MKTAITLLLLLVSYGMTAQQAIVNITEKKGKKTTEITYDGSQIVDINADLKLRIDKSALRERIGEIIPSVRQNTALQAQISQFEAALRTQEQVLNALDSNLENVENMESLYEGLTSFYNTLVAGGPETRVYQETLSLYANWQQNHKTAFDNGAGVSKEYYIFTNLNKDLDSLKSRLAVLPNTVYFVSMVAYLQTDLGSAGRVHIDNFDTYSEQDFYEVPRWVTTLSDDQLDRLKAIKAQAEANNARRASLFEELKSKFLAALPELKCVSEVKDSITDFLTDGSIAASISPAVRAKAKELIAQYEAMVTLVETVKNAVTNLDIDSVFQITSLIQQVKNRLASLKEVFTDFDALAQAIRAVAAKAEALGKDVKACVATMTQFYAAFDHLAGILKGHQNRYQDNLALGKEVKRFTLDNLPDEGYLRLTRSGKREDGDILELNLLLGIPKEGKDPTSTNPDDYEIRKLEPWSLQMQTLGLFSRTYVGLIMADPYNADSLSGVEALQERRFLYAPSAGLLLKVGSRNSRFYNDLLSPGLGVSISTPDFDTNGDPEFGTGLVLTAFNNILSIGINYNITLDVPYWSFGVNLPFSLPGIPINRPQ